MKTYILDINDSKRFKINTFFSFDDFSMCISIKYSNRSLRIKLIFWLYTFQLYNIHDEYSNIINSFLDDKQLNE